MWHGIICAMYTHASKLSEAFRRFNDHCSHHQVNVFRFTHYEVNTVFEMRQTKKDPNVLTKVVISNETKEIGVVYELEVVGGFRGTMVDNLVQGIKADFALFGCFYDETVVEPGVEKSTKIECVRFVKGTNKLPSMLTDAELDATWLNPDWNPFDFNS